MFCKRVLSAYIHKSIHPCTMTCNANGRESCVDSCSLMKAKTGQPCSPLLTIPAWFLITCLACSSDPTGVQLLRRHLEVTNACPLCVIDLLTWARSWKRVLDFLLGGIWFAQRLTFQGVFRALHNIHSFCLYFWSHFECAYTFFAPSVSNLLTGSIFFRRRLGKNGETTEWWRKKMVLSLTVTLC